jgi:hypothetical protein
MRPLFELDKAVPVKLHESALIELPSSKLGLLSIDVGAGVGAVFTVDEAVIFEDDVGGVTAEILEEADTETIIIGDVLGVEDKTTVEEGAGDEDGEDKAMTGVFDVEVKAVVAVISVEAVKEELRRTTLDEVGAEEDTGALEVEETIVGEVEATTEDDTIGLDTGVAAAADEGIGVEEYVAVVDEDAGATLVSR